MYNPRQEMFWETPLSSCRGNKVFKLQEIMQQMKVHFLSH